MSTSTCERTELGPAESLTEEWLKLPLEVMRRSGPAVQSFAGLLQVTHRETFVSVATIARHAHLPLKTARKQLQRLAHDGWIVNAGRQSTRRGILRRTATLQLTDAARLSLSRYGVLPWWACIRRGNRAFFPWSAKALLSIVMARLMSLKGAAAKGDVVDDSDLWLLIEHLGGQERFAFSLNYLQQQTGLSREAVIQAKRELARHNIIHWMGGYRDDGALERHVLWPNEDFRVIVERLSETQRQVSFREVAHSGVE